MLARLRRLSIVTRILAVATLSLVVLSGTLFVVVKQTIEATTFDQTRAEVIHAEGMLRYLADQKGPPTIVDGKLVFGRWVTYHNYALVDAVMDGYVTWREQSMAVTMTYAHWKCAPRDDRTTAFDAYLAALDCEEEAASAYRRLLEQAAA